MDIETVKDTVTITRDCIAALAAATGGWVAWRGLQTWKRQLLGQSAHALAKRLLVSAYTAKEDIRAFRNAMITPSEGAHALADSGADLTGITGEERREREFDAGYGSRLRSLISTWLSSRPDRLEAAALWGPAATRHFKDLEIPMQELVSAVYQYTRRRDRKYSPQRLQKIEDIVFDSSEDELSDAFAQKVDVAVNAIEDFLLPHIGTRSIDRKPPIALKAPVKVSFSNDDLIK